MTLPLFLAKRFYRSGHREQKGKASAPAIRIAVLGVALGLAVMIISICVVKGFKNEISDKVIGFGSHIEVLNMKSLPLPEAYPIVTDQALIKQMASVEGVAHVQRSSQKTGILKTENDFKGITLKGIGKEYDLSFLKQHVVEGQLPAFADENSANKIVISRQQADALGLHAGDKVFAYFFERTVKTRRFEIAAVYNTNMSQFDNLLVFASLDAVNKLNGWEADQSSRLEIQLKDPKTMDETAARMADLLNGRADRNASAYSVATIKDLYPQIFSWLNLLDFNVAVILVLMVCVAGFTMISGLFILILERTSTIGILKALGAGNTSIRRTFLCFAVFIISRGLLWGNIAGIGLVALQAKLGLVKLDAATYYVDTVPVEINWGYLLMLNLATLIITTLALVVPSYMISRVQPAKAIRFD